MSIQQPASKIQKNILAYLIFQRVIKCETLLKADEERKLSNNDLDPLTNQSMANMVCLGFFFFFFPDIV